MSDSEDYIRQSDSEDDVSDSGFMSRTKPVAKRAFEDAFDSDKEDGVDSDEEEFEQIGKNKKLQNGFGSEDEDDDEDEDSNNENESGIDEDALMEQAAADARNNLDLEQIGGKTQKLKKLTPKQLEKQAAKIKKTGVVYISRVPPYMKPTKMRQVLSRFGEVGRLFLKPEDQSVYKRRVKTGGNKKKKFDEGWVEFANKKDAKLCAFTLNGNTLGGKKGNFYYDDIINVKYLKHFKWDDLTSQISRENEIREAKLQAELSQAQKLNKTFIQNVEKSKMVKNMQERKKQRKDYNPQADVEVKRSFEQREVTSTRADSKFNKTKMSDKVNNVLNSVF
ncbi:unnamed protein product [Kuraishia capsulata CBS 1993]|uniref:Pre-rRNA-processing protein ESF2 n=1 Tax=Kuraishia capsulata CBS 1993 TaxID=1382522 RepID=W6MJL1_9ASCO|nr:uncharacterized protein KUCA_T00002703001 [Kuraishia capsulata CBS 1993]CDK26729.1 unnamed protein product [Kuraishia capsulata CBS 1993]